MNDLVIWELRDKWESEGYPYRRCLVTPERAKELDALAEAAGFVTTTNTPDDDARAETWIREMTPTPPDRRSHRGNRRARTDAGRA
jgi:hypothetical protein